MSRHLPKKGYTVEEELISILANTLHGCVEDGCYTWIGCTNTDGYPKLTRVDTFTGKSSSNVKGHRHVYELLHDVTLGKEEVVRHRCDNPRCIRPDHLVVGTFSDNVRDRCDRFRTANAVGFEEIRKIKTLSPHFENKVELANLLNIPVKRLYYVLKKYVGD